MLDNTNLKSETNEVSETPSTVEQPTAQPVVQPSVAPQANTGTASEQQFAFGEISRKYQAAKNEVRDLRTKYEELLRKTTPKPTTLEPTKTSNPNLDNLERQVGQIVLADTNKVLQQEYKLSDEDINTLYTKYPGLRVKPDKDKILRTYRSDPEFFQKLIKQRVAELTTQPQQPAYVDVRGAAVTPGVTPQLSPQDQEVQAELERPFGYTFKRYRNRKK